PRPLLGVAVEERLAVALPGCAVVAPRQDRVADPRLLPTRVGGQVVAQHAEHADQRLTAGDHAAHAVELRLAGVFCVGSDDGPGALPADQVVADALEGDAALPLPVLAGGVGGDEGDVAIANR